MKLIAEVLVLLLTICGSQGAPKQGAVNKPHIFMIVADDLGWDDVSFHGSPQIPTPNLDALANSGVILNNYYVSPMDTPTRASFMTGKYPIHLGVQHDTFRNRQPTGVPLGEKFLPEYLRTQGYKTHAVGKWQLGFFAKEYTPVYRGFDSFFGFWSSNEDYFNHVANDGGYGLDLRKNMDVVYNATGVYGTELFAREAEKVIEDHVGEQPLFLYLAHQAVHVGNMDEPLQAPKRYLEKFSYIADKRRRIFAGMVSSLDESIRQLVTTLKKKGLYDNSIIVFTTDNGGAAGGLDMSAGSNFPLRGNKNTLWEGGVRGVAFIHSPLIKSKGRVYNGLLHATDWLPTFHALAGGNPRSLGQIDGYNVWQAISTGAQSPRYEVLHGIDTMLGNRAALRVGDYKLVLNQDLKFYSDWYKRPESAHELDYIRKPRLLRNASVDCAIKFPHPLLYTHAPICRPQKKPCLFNIKWDPCEYHNLASFMPNTLKVLLDRLKFYAEGLKPAIYPEADNRANPDLTGGVWIPWRDDPTIPSTVNDYIYPLSYEDQVTNASGRILNQNLRKFMRDQSKEYANETGEQHKVVFKNVSSSGYPHQGVTKPVVASDSFQGAGHNLPPAVPRVMPVAPPVAPYVPPTEATTPYVPVTQPTTKATTPYIPPTQSTAPYVPPTQPPVQYVPPTQPPVQYVPPTQPPVQYVPPARSPVPYVPPAQTSAPYVPPATQNTEQSNTTQSIVHIPNPPSQSTTLSVYKTTEPTTPYAAPTAAPTPAPTPAPAPYTYPPTQPQQTQPPPQQQTSSQSNYVAEQNIGSHTESHKIPANVNNFTIKIDFSDPMQDLLQPVVGNPVNQVAFKPHNLTNQVSTSQIHEVSSVTPVKVPFNLVHNARPIKMKPNHASAKPSSFYNLPEVLDIIDETKVPQGNKPLGQAGSGQASIPKIFDIIDEMHNQNNKKVSQSTAYTKGPTATSKPLTISDVGSGMGIGLNGLPGGISVFGKLGDKLLNRPTVSKATHRHSVEKKPASSADEHNPHTFFGNITIGGKTYFVIGSESDELAVIKTQLDGDRIVVHMPRPKNTDARVAQGKSRIGTAKHHGYSEMRDNIDDGDDDNDNDEDDVRPVVKSLAAHNITTVPTNGNNGTKCERIVQLDTSDNAVVVSSVVIVVIASAMVVGVAVVAMVAVVARHCQNARN